MFRSFLLFGSLAVGWAAADQAAAQTTSGVQARPRVFNPFVPHYSRLSVNRFGLPQFRAGGTGSTVVRTGAVAVSAPLAAAVNPLSPPATSDLASSAKIAKADSPADEIPQAAVTRPTYRPPVRSPYRPPPRPPF